MTELAKLEVGQAAPAFALLNQADQKVSLESYRGKKVIVYFYPAASTPGCTKEACDFNDNLNPLKEAGYSAVSYTHLTLPTKRIV